MRVCIVVTHLLGSGHLRRCINLSLEFLNHGHSVTLISGGLPVKSFDLTGITLIQIPPLSSDGTNFSRLLREDGAVADAKYLQAREDKIVTVIKSVQPDLVVTELFPFGRRMLRAEFIALLKAAKSLPAVPVILSSVRDILAAPSSEKKVQRTEALINDYYDGVLVHSDHATTPLSASWPVTELIKKKLLYTGYVAQAMGALQSVKSNNEVIVSAGGGSVGRRVYETAIHASRILSDVHWRILVGGSDASAEVARLRTLASDSVCIIEPNRPDFRALLKGAICSVSMCGYNTAIDLLSTGTPGVLIPFDAGGEEEQTLRAKSLADREAYHLLLDKDLTPENLCRAVSYCRTAGRFSADDSLFNGAVESVAFATTLVDVRR